MEYRFKIEVSDARGPFVEIEVHTQEQCDKAVANAERLGKKATVTKRW